ncbi:MAG: hypothetical protein ACI4EG_12925 [Fusicatenibacter sp.]|nr:hypothetical protein [Fusicatenibacter sp.]
MRSGSLTAEAAVALPLFLIAVLILLKLVDVYRLHAMLTVSLQESAKYLSICGYAVDEKENGTFRLPEMAVCIAYARMHLPEECKESGTVSFLGSKVEDERIELKATCYPKIGNRLIPLRVFGVTACASVSAFCGDSGSETSKETESALHGMVYVTDYESVYHTDSNCTHISLTIHETTQSLAEVARNKSGERYRPCEHCIGSGVTEEVVYISESGNRYHNSFECSGLTRNVRLISREDAEGLDECSRCAKKSQAALFQER